MRVYVAGYVYLLGGVVILLPILLTMIRATRMSSLFRSRDQRVADRRTINRITNQTFRRLTSRRK